MNTAPSAPSVELVHGLEDRPPPLVTLVAACQHLLGVFVSVATVPLIISLGMGLTPEDAAYMVGASLVVSGVATLIQVTRPGPLGSGLLSVQGTSFAFVGPFIYLATLDPAGGDVPSAAWLGALFGSSAFCAVLVMVLSRGLHRLSGVITPTVTGCTILVIGVSLTLVTVDTMLRVHRGAIASGADVGPHWLMFSLVTATIGAILLRGGPLMRVNAVFAGLGVGLVLAAVLGALPNLEAAEGAAIFVVDPLRWPLSLDAGVIAVLLPIYLVSAVESIGDLTATSAISGRPVAGEEYWQRLRGGVLGDGFNSLLAALCCTFPNTTFSQNNGVIRVTGIASRRVGIVLACMIAALGTLPFVARLFLALPEAVLAGVTGIMFAMVGVAGAQILRSHAPGRRGAMIAVATVVTSVGLARITPVVDGVPELVRSVLAFPIASAVVFAIVFDKLLPGRGAPLPSTAAVD